MGRISIEMVLKAVGGYHVIKRGGVDREQKVCKDRTFEDPYRKRK